VTSGLAGRVLPPVVRDALGRSSNLFIQAHTVTSREKAGRGGGRGGGGGGRRSEDGGKVCTVYDTVSVHLFARLGRYYTLSRPPSRAVFLVEKPIRKQSHTNQHAHNTHDKIGLQTLRALLPTAHLLVQFFVQK
jgi:hypothetical protein